MTEETAGRTPRTDTAGIDAAAVAGFDAFELLQDSDPVPPLTVWESLARNARELAEAAERLSKVAPEDLAPRFEQTGDPDDDVPVLVDPLRTLTEYGQTAQRLAAACRRDVWARLHDEGRGLTQQQIADMWGIKRAAVGNALSRGDNR